MNDLPADWAIKKAIALCKAEYGDLDEFVVFRGHAFARYIEAHEPAPVDRKLKCAREAFARSTTKVPDASSAFRAGEMDRHSLMPMVLEALTLYEEGYGNDPLS